MVLVQASVQHAQLAVARQSRPIHSMCPATDQGALLRSFSLASRGRARGKARGGGEEGLDPIELGRRSKCFHNCSNCTIPQRNAPADANGCRDRRLSRSAASTLRVQTVRCGLALEVHIAATGSGMPHGSPCCKARTATSRRQLALSPPRVSKLDCGLLSNSVHGTSPRPAVVWVESAVSTPQGGSVI